MVEEPVRSSATRLDDAVGATLPSGRLEKVFGSTEFFWLWIAQLVSAMGDWLGLLAIIALAARISEGSGGTAIALVLGARVVPGLFLATAAGVMVDRLNRKHVMIACDIGRALVLVTLPFVDTILGLVIASFILEMLTMMWSPAKEAIVPNIVPRDKLTTANSLNVAAAYGMFPVAAGVAALLAKAAEKLPDEGWVDTWRLNETGLAFYVDGLTFMVAAFIIWRIAIPTRSKEQRRAGTRGSWDLGGTVRDLREGWQFIAVNPIVRAVNVGLATGVMGGGMLVPLGAIFVDEVIMGSDADFQLVLFALGLGMAFGVVAASAMQNRINRSRAFPMALILAGLSLAVAASSQLLTIVVPVVGLLGFFAGPIYVLGFTLLHENVDDDMRGRIFSALLVLVRLCMLISLAVAPLLSDLLNGLADDIWGGDVELIGRTILIPGVRITMWLASVIIIAAGVLASWSLRAGGMERESLLVEDVEAMA